MLARYILCDSLSVRPVRGRGTARRQVVQRDSPRHDVIGQSTRPIATDVCFLIIQALVMLPLYQIIFSSACVKNDTNFVTSVTRNVSHCCNVSHIQVTSLHANSG